MAIFEIKNHKVNRIKPTEFTFEKDLQKLVEDNLETFFNCRFIATEFSTGSLHSGRIDSLALSEDNNPVIIEYKKVASSDLINQSLFYLHWITDHKGDFQVAVNNALKEDIEVDWSDIRVICIAPEFKKYDLHAVKVMGANIELWQYKLYENGIMNITEVFKKSEKNQKKGTKTSSNDDNKGLKQQAESPQTVMDSINKLPHDLAELFKVIQEYIVNLDSSVEEAPKKFYMAYKTTQNFVCLEPQKKKLLLYLKINYGEMDNPPKQVKDVKNKGHFGTGDLELTIKTLTDFEENKELINRSLKNIGG